MTTQSDIIDNLKVVCICKGIKKGTFKKLVAEGVTTVAGLQQKTGAGSGSCGGKRCGPKLLDLIMAENENKK
jgi:bacterioferritin-associated ferredoxin